MFAGFFRNGNGFWFLASKTIFLLKEYYLEGVFAGIGDRNNLELSEVICGKKANCWYDAAEIL